MNSDMDTNDINAKNINDKNTGNIEVKEAKNEAKNNMAKDTLLYLPAKIIEGIIGILTLSAYTEFFKSEGFGIYNLSTVTVNIVSLFLLGWLFQSTYRYINEFTGEKNIKVFYSTIAVAWMIISVFTVIISIPVFLLIKNNPHYIGNIFKIDNITDFNISYVMTLIIFMFVTNGIFQILLTMLSAARVIRLYLVLSVFSALFKLLITYFLVKFYSAGVYSALLSIVVVDLAAAIAAIFRLKIYRYVNFSMFSKELMRKFMKYGIPLVGVSLSLSLLSYSDRYIITFFSGLSDVGKYSSNYSIASSVFSMLLFAIMRGVYPSILKAWKQSSQDKTEELLSNGIRYYLLITVPAVVGISILSPIISGILDPSVAGGSITIVWVSIGMFFLGLSEYNNKAWELTSNTKPIFRNSLLCCLFNIVANIILIPVFGYMAAAVNTTLAYLLYFLLSFFGGRKLLKWHLPYKTYIKIFGSAAVMGIIIYMMSKALPSGLYMLFILVPAGMAIYGVCLYISGEIRAEMQQLKISLISRIGNIRNG